MPRLTAAIALAAALLPAGCGQTGPLYLPQPEEPGAAPAVTAEQPPDPFAKPGITPATSEPATTEQVTTDEKSEPGDE